MADAVVIALAGGAGVVLAAAGSNLMTWRIEREKRAREASELAKREMQARRQVIEELGMVRSAVRASVKAEIWWPAESAPESPCDAWGRCSDVLSAVLTDREWAQVCGPYRLLPGVRRVRAERLGAGDGRQPRLGPFDARNLDLLLSSLDLAIAVLQRAASEDLENRVRQRADEGKRIGLSLVAAARAAESTGGEARIIVGPEGQVDAVGPRTPESESAGVPRPATPPAPPTAG